MDNLKYDVTEEYKNVLEEVCSKFNYSDDLKTVLEKITEAALKEKSYEERQIFYKMLKTTPIVVIPENAQITDKEIIERMIGDVNPHIKQKDVDIGEYGKQKAAGAFVSEPVMDENLNLTGVKKFLYVKSFDTNKKLSTSDQRYFDTFKTGINVPHLIHELGHAWVSEVNPYSIEDGILTQRLGTTTIKYKIEEVEKGKYESEEFSRTGLYLEEGLNTNFEEKTLAKYLGITLEECKELYKTTGILIPSQYQSNISNMTERFSQKTFKKDLEKWRFSGDKSALENLNDAFEKTNLYQKRTKLFERRNDLEEEKEDEDLITARNRIFNNPENERCSELLGMFEKDFFPNAENMTPMEMMDNILLQYYDISVHKFKFDIENYKKIITVIAKEGYGLINQAEKLKAQEKEQENQK